jgi:hypothetical protein
VSLTPVAGHPHPFVRRETGPSGDQVWWRLHITEGLRRVWLMAGVADADLVGVVANGIASSDWYWSLDGGLSVVFRHEADALKAAERFDDRLVGTEGRTA